jgi:TDG/mug DNA glycosylase family protein
MSASNARPSRAQLAAAAGQRVPDLIAPALRVLFCGINPSLYSAAVGHHFARPGNRFWPALHQSGFTSRLLAPAEEHELLAAGLGITNLFDLATATAAELTKAQLHEGAAQLRAKILHYRPAVLAMLGVTAWRDAFGQPRAGYGLQPDRIGATALWILPNPSGLNAHFQVADLARLFAELRRFVDALPAASEQTVRL